jgi:hypothetical protein
MERKKTGRASGGSGVLELVGVALGVLEAVGVSLGGGGLAVSRLAPGVGLVSAPAQPKRNEASRISSKRRLLREVVMAILS